MHVWFPRNPNKVRVGAILAFAAMAACHNVMADTPAADWLKRMAESHRTLNYQGVVRYQIEGSTNNFKISHIVKGDSEYESLESLDDAESSVVRHGHDLNCVHPGPELLRLLSANSTENSLLHSYYSLAVAEPGRVAGRESVTIDVRPKDVYRLGYRLGIDEESGLLLKSEILNKQGKVLESFQYLVLDMGLSAESERAAVMPAAHDKVLEASSHLDHRWKVGWLPDGFTPLSGYRDAESLSYTDGLAVFSVFVESFAIDHSVPPDSHMRRGASVSYSTIYPEQGRRVTVVGEVPMLTARQVARSIKWALQ